MVDITDWSQPSYEHPMDGDQRKHFQHQAPGLYSARAPSADVANPVNAQDFNEGKAKYSATDIRFNQHGKFVYVTTFGAPTGKTIIISLGKNTKNGNVKKITLLGSPE